MEADVVKQFSQELASLYEAKPPVSKAKMVQITKLAIKGIKYYKHIVMAVEKFIHKCKAEYKLPGLYVVDSIVRQSRHQFGADKDLFAPRFGKNIVLTFQSLNQAVDEDKPKILRVLNLWLQNGVFTEDILQPVVELAASFAIGENDDDNNEKQIAPDKGRRQAVNSPKLAQDNRQDYKNSTTPPLELRPQRRQTDVGATTTTIAAGVPSGDHSNLDPSFLQQIQKLTSTLITQQKIAADSERRLTKKILADYDYSDEDSGDEGSSEKGAVQSKEVQNDDITANLAAAAQNLLNNPQLLQQIQQMQKSMRNPTSIAAPPSLPVQSAMHQQHSTVTPATRMPVLAGIPPAPTNIAPPQFNAGIRFPPANFSMPPPNYSIPPPSVVVEQHPQPPVVHRQIDPQAMNYPPPAEPLPPGFENQRHLDTDDRRRQRGLEIGSKRRKSRDKSRSRSKSRGEKKRKRKSRSRSGSQSRGRHRRNRSRSTERRNREKERERERRGLPPLKTRYVTICSRTLWFGRVPPYCEQEEIKQAVKEYGEPVSIDLIPPRGCAYIVMPDRKSAFKVLDRLKDLRIQNRNIKMAWAPGKGVKKAYNDEWDAESGATYIVYDQLPQDLTPFLDGGTLDVDSLPENLKPVYDENGRIGAGGLSQQIPIPPNAMPPTAMMTPMSYPHFPSMPGYPSPMIPPYGPPIMSAMTPGGQASLLLRQPPLQSNLHNVSLPQMGLPPAPGNPMATSLQQPPTFGIRIPTSAIAGGHTIPSLLSSSPIVEQQQQHYPYSPAARTPSSPYRGRGRGGGYAGDGLRPSWGQQHGDDSSSEQRQQHSNYERNFRGRGGGGFGGQGRGSGYYQRGGGGQQHSRYFEHHSEPHNNSNAEGSSSMEDRTQSTASHESSFDASSDDVHSGGGAASRRKSRWGSTPSFSENSATTTTNENNTSNIFDSYAVRRDSADVVSEQKQEIVSTENVAMVESENENETVENDEILKNESETKNELEIKKVDNDSSLGDDLPPEPEPGRPPETVVEEREVNDDGDRYDQRGLGMLLKMMNNP